MSVITKINLYDPIMPNEGIGQIKLLSNAFVLRKFILDNRESWSYQGHEWLPDYIFYTYKECIEIGVSVYLGVITHIRLTKGYEGKIFDQIKVGSTVKELREACPHLSFDENVLLGDSEFNILFEIDNDYDDIYDLDEVNHHIITSIIIRIHDLVRVALAAEEMPKTWTEFLKEGGNMRFDV